MSVVEDLIVAMKFDNKQFEAAVKVSAITLSALKNNLNFGGAPNGIDKAAASAAKFNGAPMSAQIDGISAKFLALGAVAGTAISNITNKVVNAATEVGKSFTTGPITQGFNEYELKMKSIQTILANTSKNYGGDENKALADITGNLDELNKYADQTIYNFGDMTKNIGLFTNAGLGVKESTDIIKGFSNEAAASGTSAEGAAGAAYQLSQGLSAGVLTLQDFRSLQNVGMGNSNMKKGIVEIAEAMGAFEGTGTSANEANKDFNKTLEKRWLSKDVMSNYFKLMAEGDEKTSREMSKKLGLTEAQATAFFKQQKTANDAATKVRTFTALMDTLKEGVGSGWSETFGIILGDFQGATKLFTGIKDSVGGVLDRMSKNRNELLTGWAAMGGRDIFLQGFKNIADAFGAVIKPIKEAFRQIFPAQTPAGLLALTKSFAAFTEKLKVGSETADKIKRTFAGVFAVFGIAVSIIKGVAAGIGSLFGAFGKGSGGILSATAGIGDFLVKLNESIKTSGIFTKIFTSIGAFLQGPILVLGALGSAVGAVLGHLGQLAGAAKTVFDILATGDFKGGPFEEDSKFVDTVFRIREAFQNAVSAIEQFWNVLVKGDFVAGVFSEDSPIIDFLFKIRESIEKFFSSTGLKLILGGGAGLALGLAIKKMIQSAFKFGSDDSDSFFGTIKGAFASFRDAADGVKELIGSVTDSFKAMQNNLKAGTLLKIGAAIALVAVSILLLSTIDPKDLAIAMAGVVGAMTALLGGMAVLSKLSGAGSIASMPALAVSMVALSAAVLVLAGAMKLLSSMSWEEIAKGGVALGAIVAVIAGAAYILSKAEGPLLRAGLAIVPFAAGVLLLSVAVKSLAQLNWEELAKGLGAIAVALTAVTLAMRFMPENMGSIGTGLVLVGGALVLIARAITSLGSLDIGSLAKGVGGMAASLGIIALALNYFPEDMAEQGAGLLLVGGALVIIAQAVNMFGGMSWPELAKGLIGLGGSLAILAIGLKYIAEAEGGAEEMAKAAAALILLMVPIGFFAAMSWEELVKGLLGLAGVFAVIGAAGYLLGPVIPVISALGVAIAFIGLGLGAVGLGVLAFSLGLKGLLEVMALGQAAFMSLLAMIPQIAIALANGVTSFITTLADNAGAIATSFKDLIGGILDSIVELVPKIKTVFGTLLGAIFQLITENAPKFLTAFNTLIDTLLQAITTNLPKIIEAGYNMLLVFMIALRDRIPAIVGVATDIVVAFLNALGQNLPRIIQAGFDMIVNFLNGLADAIEKNMPRITEAAGRIGKAIIEGVVNAIKGGVGLVIDAAKNMAKSAYEGAKNFLKINSPSKRFMELGAGIVEGLVKGVDDNKGDAQAVGSKIASGAVAGFTKGAGKQFPKALDAVFKKLQEGFALKKGEKLFGPMAGGFTSLSKEILKADLALAEFYGEVNRADPKSVEAYVQKAGGQVKYLTGLMDGLKEASDIAFGQMAEGKSLDKVLGSEDFLSAILKTGLSVIPGIEGTLITSGVFLGLAVIDGILSVFLGPGTTVLGTLGKWISKLVRAIGGWFGIKFPVDEELSESDKALEDFMVNVDDGHGRFEKLTEEAVKSLTDQLSEADKLAQGIDGMSPVIKPRLDLKDWDKGIDLFLDSLNTGPGFGVFKVLGSFGDFISNGVKNMFGGKSPVAPAPTTNVTYNQTNNSPKALDHVEVYKATKSQISLAREGLGIS